MAIPALKQDLSVAELKRIGLLSGLEIHQQLEGQKLFCHCPTAVRDDNPDFLVKRYFRALAGESGVVDAAALAEMKKRKYNVYQGYEDTTCLVELDEEPPGPVNQEALTAALQVAKIFDMEIIDQVRFMRKTVVDGSNTSGFQRTGLIAVNGSLETPSGLWVHVDSLCLEEDACKKVETKDDHEVYNLSRLGIPLLEVATGPDMKTPEAVAEVAEHIGMVMRSLPNVKRGLGTIRQDVNVSIKKGVRVEIKGAQDLRMVSTLVKYEALRQHNLLMIFDALEARRASVGKVVDVTDVFKHAEAKVIRGALEKQDVVLAVPLHSFGGLTGLETQPGRRYGAELSDHAKVMGVKGLFHADELPKHGISQAEKDAVFKQLGLQDEKDNFLLIAAPEAVARRAIAAAAERAQDFSLRKEVRMALPDGTTSYLRPMPGAARMYPETDVKPVLPDKENIVVPALLSERVAGLAKKFSLDTDMAKRLLKDGVDLDALTKKYTKVKPAFIVDLFYSVPALLKKKHNVEVDMSLYADELLARIDADEISKDAVPGIALLLASGKTVDYEKYKPISEKEIKEVIKEVIRKDPKAPVGALMGAAMKELGGKADGKLVMKLLQELTPK
ncbi:Glu-tRNA(Gln) amidotransferase subunit GatE [Candidatus Woesearchaeota archaeon]|nr:Glu-tRNA(Gln) amidotransferase subunit GatE [Candidatus Woesearchaeota archaeon]